MKSILPPESERIYALRAMKTIAMADGDLHEKELHMIKIAASTLKVDTAVEELAEITPEELAENFTDPQAREALVQRLVMLTTLDGEVTEDEVNKLEELALALGSDERAVFNLHQLIDGKLKRLMADMVRRSFMPSKLKWLATEASLTTVWGVAKALLGITDAKMAARYEALGDLPEGTLGRAFFVHHVDNGFALPGQKGGFPPAMAFHDVGHVLGGYGTDGRSEMLVAGFQAGYLDEDPLVMYMMICMLFQLGIERIAEMRHVEPEKGQLDLDAYRIAYLRGRAMNQSILNWDPWPHMERSLDEVRTDLGIPPADAIPAV